MTENPPTAWTHGTLRNPTPAEPEPSRAASAEVNGPEWLLQLGAVKFTQIVSEAYRDQGYQVQFMVDSVSGVDLVLLRGSDRILVSFERRRVTVSDVDVVQRLDRAVTAQSASWGLAITACGFTAEAYEFAEHTRITLLDGEAVAQLLAIGPLQPVTPIPPPTKRIPSSPSATIPTCPACHTAMVLHSEDAAASSYSWICPKCTHAETPAPPRRTLGHLSQDGEWQGALGRWRQLSNH
ncbi:MAG TPA: restriction endonuclease [Propionicimonas sp.]|jgi:predicted RNA-binding Zn-ribbon protein involved in translation (DUF1610 family)|nr:restriction endonuclease [Propionicimonas sp.]